MRKITARERNKQGHIYCPYCKPEKVDAVWRETGLLDKFKLNIHVSCDLHKNLIPVAEKQLSKPLHVIDLRGSQFTEADYQTWMRG